MALTKVITNLAKNFNEKKDYTCRFERAVYLLKRFEWRVWRHFKRRGDNRVVRNNNLIK